MVDDRQSDANENDDPDGFEVFCKAIAIVAHTPLGLIVEATARRFPSHSLTRIIVDVRKRSAALLEPGLLYTLLNLINHILCIVVSIEQHQGVSGSDAAGNAHTRHLEIQHLDYCKRHQMLPEPGLQWSRAPSGPSKANEEERNGGGGCE